MILPSTVIKLAIAYLAPPFPDLLIVHVDVTTQANNKQKNNYSGDNKSKQQTNKQTHYLTPSREG